MKRLLLHVVCPLITAFLCLSSPVRASHLMGSDIQWTCLGTDTYLVTVTIYRDCNGIPLSQQGVKLFDGCKFTEITSGVGVAKQITAKDVTLPPGVCPGQCTRCAKSPNGTNSSCTFVYGIEEFQFQQKIVLPSKKKNKCSTYLFSWDNCCRNGAITTGASGESFHVEGMVNRDHTPCAGSPQFNNPPTAIVCVKSCVSMNPGLEDYNIDAFGNPDSLVYYLDKPTQSRSGKTLSFTDWSGKFKYNKPLTFDSFPNANAQWNPPNCRGFHVDSLTGDIQFSPQKLEQTIFSMKVEQWAKNATTGLPELIGYTHRDMQVIVVKCPNNHIPVISGVDGTNSFDADFCVGQYNCFTINTNDADPKDTVTIKWNNALARYGATFVSEVKKQHPRATFCWKPSPAQANHTYYFVATAHDNICPVPGITQRTFRIHVHPSPTGKVSVVNDGCGNFTLKLKLDTLNTISGLPVWSGDQGLSATGYSVSHHYRISGGMAHYEVTFGKKFVSAAGIQICNTVDTGSFYIPPYVLVTIPHDTVVCKANKSSFTIQSTVSGGTTPYIYLWNNGSTKDSIGVTVTQDSTVWVRVTDNNGSGCNNADTIHIHALVPPKPDLGNDQRHCAGDIAQLKDNGIHDSLGYHWFNSLNLSKSISDSLTAMVTDSGQYILRVNDTRLRSCFNADTINVFYNQPVLVVPQTINACSNTPLTLDAGKGKGDTNATWKWRDLYNPSIIYYSGRKVNLTLTRDMHFLVTTYQKYKGTVCGDSDTINVLLYPLPSNVTSSIPNQCLNNPPVDLTVYTSTPGGVWLADTAKSTSRNAVVNKHFYPDSAGTGLHGVIYQTTDPTSGCKNIHRIPVTVDNLPIVLTKDSFQCIDNPQPFDLTTIELQPKGGSWSGPAVTSNRYFNQNDPNAGGAGVKDFVYSYQDKLKNSHCTGYDTAHVTVYARLQPNAGSNQAVCKYPYPDVPVLLGGNLDSTYNATWIPSRYSSNTPDSAIKTVGGQYYFYPSIADTGDHVLYFQVSYGKQHRCPQLDSTVIHVNSNPQIRITQPGAICRSGGPVQLTATPRGGTFTLANGNPSALIGNYFYPDKTGPGTYTLLYSVYTSGCFNKDSITLQVDDTLHLHIINRDPGVCAGPSAQIPIRIEFGSSIKNVEWSRPPGVQFVPGNSSTTATYVTSKDTSFWVSVSVTALDISGTTSCPLPSDAVLVVMQHYPVPVIDAPNNSGCTPLTVNFTDRSTVTGGEISSREWNFGDNTTSTDQSPSHVYTRDTTAPYRVSLKVSTPAGCTALTTAQVQVFATPRPWFTADPFYTTIIMPDITFNDSTTINDPKISRGDLVHKWDFGDGSTSDTRAGTFVHTYNDTGIYTVKLFVRNPEYNCSAETIRVNYIDIRPELLVFIPNAFTPNHLYNQKTLVNEKFSPVISNFSSYSMKVFSRWGELLYQTTDIEKGWDGTFLGRSCHEGVYIYEVNATSLEGKKYKYSGSITLLK